METEIKVGETHILTRSPFVLSCIMIPPKDDHKKHTNDRNMGKYKLVIVTNLK
jgi:hypothetical protein